MNLFRSEEHVRSWKDFDPFSEEGIRPLVDLVELFTLPVYRERLSSDYLLRMPQLRKEIPSAFERIGRSSAFWRR